MITQLLKFAIHHESISPEIMGVILLGSAGISFIIKMIIDQITIK